MEIEYILASSHSIVASQQVSEPPDTVVVQSVNREEKLLEVITQLSEKIDTLFTSQPHPSPRAHTWHQPDTLSARKNQSTRGPRKSIVCYKCHQEGHFARGCVAQSRVGNGPPQAS